MPSECCYKKQTHKHTHKQKQTNTQKQQTHKQKQTQKQQTHKQKQTHRQTHKQKTYLQTHRQTIIAYYWPNKIQQPTLCTPLVDFGAAFFRKLWPIRPGIGHRAAITCLNFMSYVM